MRRLLEEQYVSLIDWLDDMPVTDHVDKPVGLGTWTVGDLVAHLGLGIGLCRFVTTAGSDADPLSFGVYVSAYPPAADQIVGMTREIFETYGDDLVGGVRRTAVEGLAALDATPGDVLQARRGAITRRDYLLTRLLELVVHGDDLQRALRRADAPVLPDAVDAVSDALTEAYVARAERVPDESGLTWIRLAAGRMPSSDPYLPLL